MGMPYHGVGLLGYDNVTNQFQQHFFTDGTRTVKLHLMTGFDHTGYMLMVYLPNEKLLADGDAYTPLQTPTTPLTAPKVRYAARCLLPTFDV